MARNKQNRQIGSLVGDKSQGSARPDKELELKELTEKLRVAGFKVRREKLKQGPGWKTISGSCRVGTEKLVFVDRRLALEEQVLFLRSLSSDLERVRSE